MNDTHVQHRWELTHPTGGRLVIETWRDGETVRVYGGDGEAYSGPLHGADAYHDVVTDLLPAYQARGWALDPVVGYLGYLGYGPDEITGA